MRLPVGAAAPAMNVTTGFFTFSLMYLAAFCSSGPPISPMSTMPSVSGSALNRFRMSTMFRPWTGSPPMPTAVLWPKPSWVVW